MDGMERSQYEYLRINKFFLRSIGRWPYQTLLEKILVGILFIPIVTVQVILQGGGILTAMNVNDIDVVTEGFPAFAISSMCFITFINFIVNNEQMRNILDIMREDWKLYSVSSKELKILRQHYAVGKRITFNYAVSIYGSMTSFMMVPTLLNAADALGFYNLSGERPLMFRVEHFVDADKYYYPLLIHSYLSTLGFCGIVVACDSMLLVNVQHECGLCEILGRRLKDFMDGDNANIDLYPDKRNDASYKNTRACIILHKHIIQYSKIMEDANTVSFLFQLGLTMIGISFTQFQAIANLRSPNKVLRFVSFSMCILSILFLNSWRGQQMTDSTDRIFEYTTSGKWYYSSIKCRKLISIMLSKSVLPIKLTAGKIYILNLINFSAGVGLITALYVNYIDAFTEGFAAFAISSMCLVKLFNIMINGEQMKNILDMMRNDWKIYSVSSKELEILCQRYAIGRRITRNYADIKTFINKNSAENAYYQIGYLLCTDLTLLQIWRNKPRDLQKLPFAL
ncbi:uncharacterized protein LOC143143723 [Ptiloglossa arizonensis]|uniref:uncharacterized protein LOC143143723 n=1 Tax=Ptiloglossa arizonensis TaxID=3350558 RepID=UPI003FA10230